jgi:hypothetical protein
MQAIRKNSMARALKILFSILMMTSARFGIHAQTSGSSNLAQRHQGKKTKG